MTIILPTELVVRVPREDELEAVCEMLNACDLVDCGMRDSPLDQLCNQWRSKEFHPETDAWIVVAPGERIVAYADVAPYLHILVNSSVRVHPDYRGRGIGTYLRSLIERRSLELVSLAPPEVRVISRAWHHKGNLAAKQLLENAGYICNRSSWAMAIDLLEAPPQPVWPEGITLRPFVPERDVRAVFEATDAAFNDHWGHLPGNFEEWYQRRIINAENFDPSLWFIAVAGDEVAGVALCDYYLDDGEVEQLGVLRPWRRKGLGLSLLYHAFGEFYRRGTFKVTLGVDSQNLTGATRLYERAGMHIELAYEQYEKELRAGVDLSTQALAM